MKLNKLSLTEMISGLKNGEFSAVELMRDHIDQINLTASLNAFCFVEDSEILEKRALLSDKRIASGSARLLEGIPFAIKDNYCEHSIRSGAGSMILDEHKAFEDAEVPLRFKNAGALSVGRTSMDEMGMGWSSAWSRYEPVFNPWGSVLEIEHLSPGGSSGGSASSVAAFCASFALGSDTGGSVRQPASFCGIVGLKPTYGRCSRRGLIAFGSSLDCPGVLTRTVEDAAIWLSIAGGPDPRDSTSFAAPLFTKVNFSSPKGKKVVIIKEIVDGLSDVPDAILAQEKAVSVLIDAGVEIEERSIPMVAYGPEIYAGISYVEAFSNLRRYDGIRYGLSEPNGEELRDRMRVSRTRGFSREVMRRLLVGSLLLLESRDTFDKARIARSILHRQMLEVLADCDGILTPAAAFGAFSVDDMIPESLIRAGDLCSVFANLAGVPGLSVPVCLTGSGLPIGAQILSAPFNEKAIFDLGFVIEQSFICPLPENSLANS